MSKKRIKKIQDYDRLYSMLFHYVRFSVKLSYRSILQVGEENIPKDGAIIFAPNHTNTLMDALVVLAYNCQPKVFVARADIFRNRKLAQIFTFLKIMPIMRQRDGISAVKKNQETIDKAVDVLKDRIPFCIFPEGTHQAKYSSLPLSKGIFRIAYQAHDLMPDVPLYIVPVGIKYGDFFRFRSTIRMEFGKPINVGEFIAENAHMTPQEQTNVLKDLLTERLHSTIFHIPNDEDYAATYEVCNAVEPFEMEKLSHSGKHTLEVQHEANKQALKRIEALKESDPDKAQKLLEKLAKKDKMRFGASIVNAIEASTTIFNSRLKQMNILAHYQITTDLYLDKAHKGVTQAIYDLVESLQNEGDLHLKIGNYRDAVKYYTKALRYQLCHISILTT